MYTLQSYPSGTFYEFLRNGKFYPVQASQVLKGLQEDKHPDPDHGFHSVVDYGVKNTGKYGTHLKRWYLFVPAGRNLAKVRGFND